MSSESSLSQSEAWTTNSVVTDGDSEYESKSVTEPATSRASSSNDDWFLSSLTAQYPFDDSEGSDTILRSVDGVAFYVYRIILSMTSPVLKDILAKLPLATSADAFKPVVNVPETSETLHALLCLCYPIGDHSVVVPTFVGDVLEAALKYEMKVAIKAMKKRLQKLAKDWPLRVYAVACQFSLEDIASLAAHTWRNQQLHTVDMKQVDWARTLIGSSYIEDMSNISAGAFYRLTQFMRTGLETSFCEYKGATAPLPNPPSTGITASTTQLTTSSTSKAVPAKLNASSITAPAVPSLLRDPAPTSTPAITPTTCTSVYTPWSWNAYSPSTHSSSTTGLKPSSFSFAQSAGTKSSSFSFAQSSTATESSPFGIDLSKDSSAQALPYAVDLAKPSWGRTSFSFAQSSTATEASPFGIDLSKDSSAQALPYAVDLAKPSSGRSEPTNGFTGVITAVRTPSSRTPAAKPLLPPPPKAVAKTPTTVPLPGAKAPSSFEPGSAQVPTPSVVLKAPSSISERASVTGLPPSKNTPLTATIPIPEPKEKNLPHNHLFQFDDSDLEIEASDGEKFSIHHLILRLAAPKMVGSVKVTSDGKKTLSLPEDSRTVSIILQLCYPSIVDEKELTQCEISVALDAAAKYGMKKVVDKLVSLLTFSSPNEVLKAYIMLARNHFIDAAVDVARNEVLLFADLSVFYVPEMEEISAQLYYSLLQYRHGCLSCRHATQREYKPVQDGLPKQTQKDYKPSALLDEQSALLKQNLTDYSKSLQKWTETRERKALGRKIAGLDL